MSPYVRRHELVHFITVVHDESSFQNKKTKQTVKPAQYGLEINFKLGLFEKRPAGCGEDIKGNGSKVTRVGV